MVMLPVFFQFVCSLKLGRSLVTMSVTVVMVVQGLLITFPCKIIQRMIRSSENLNRKI